MAHHTLQEKINGPRTKKVGNHWFISFNETYFVCLQVIKTTLAHFQGNIVKSVRLKVATLAFTTAMVATRVAKSDPAQTTLTVRCQSQIVQSASALKATGRTRIARLLESASSALTVVSITASTGEIVPIFQKMGSPCVSARKSSGEHSVRINAKLAMRSEQVCTMM